MEDKETGRLEAFSDGVFAVAITLLVLNIKILPDDVLTSGNFWGKSGLGGQLPTLDRLCNKFCNHWHHVDKSS